MTETKKRSTRGIYLIPNLLTLGTLFAGFFAIVAANKGNFHHVGLAIVAAMIMDNLDGRIARALQTSSEFGAELDSLSDMVAFGLAPGLIAYHWGLNGVGKVGWLISFFYAAATAMRLARFNTLTKNQDKRFFKGLSCPPAAGIVVGFIWMCDDYGLAAETMVYILAGLTVITAALMTSNIRYHSFKQFDLRDRVPIPFLFVALALLVIILIEPPLVLFILFCLYGLSGPVLTLHFLRKKAKQKSKAGH